MKITRYMISGRSVRLAGPKTLVTPPGLNGPCNILARSIHRARAAASSAAPYGSGMYTMAGSSVTGGAQAFD